MNPDQGVQRREFSPAVGGDDKAQHRQRPHQSEADQRQAQHPGKLTRHRIGTVVPNFVGIDEVEKLASRKPQPFGWICNDIIDSPAHPIGRHLGGQKCPSQLVLGIGLVDQVLFSRMIGRRAIEYTRYIVSSVRIRIVAIEEIHARRCRNQHPVAGNDVIAQGGGKDSRADSRQQTPRQHEPARQTLRIGQQREEQDQGRWAVEQHIGAGESRQTDQHAQAEPTTVARCFHCAHAAPNDP